MEDVAELSALAAACWRSSSKLRKHSRNCCKWLRKKQHQIRSKWTCYLNIYTHHSDRVITIIASIIGFIELLPSPKQPVKDNRDVVSDWLPILRPDKKKVTSGTLNYNEPAMYPKILEAQSPDIDSRIYGTQQVHYHTAHVFICRL